MRCLLCGNEFGENSSRFGHYCHDCEVRACRSLDDQISASGKRARPSLMVLRDESSSSDELDKIRRAAIQVACTYLDLDLVTKFSEHLDALAKERLQNFGDPAHLVLLAVTLSSMLCSIEHLPIDNSNERSAGVALSGGDLDDLIVSPFALIGDESDGLSVDKKGRG